MRVDNTVSQNAIFTTMSNEEMDVEHPILLQRKKDAARIAREKETPDQRQIRLEQQRNRSRLRRNNETQEDRESRQSKDRERARSKRAAETKEQQYKRRISDRESTQLARRNETEEQRQHRRDADKLSTQGARENETEEQRQRRRDANKLDTQTSRSNETTDQTRKRKKNNNERTKAARQNETEEQHKKRLERQKQRSQVNAAKNKINKRSSSGSYAYFRKISALSDGSNQLQTHINDIDDHSNNNADSTFTIWPEPIPCSLKNSLLQQFVKQMFMSALAETNCAVCNVRTSVMKAKKVPIDKIPSLHLLEVPQDLKNLIITSHSLSSKNFSALSDTNANTAQIGQNSLGNGLSI